MARISFLSLSGAMKRGRGTEFAGVTIAALCLYLPFLSIQYDPNGVLEAMSIESGTVLNKNHILYRPLGLLVWRVAQVFGYHGPSLPVLQIITGIAGALG